MFKYFHNLKKIAHYYITINIFYSDDIQSLPALLVSLMESNFISEFFENCVHRYVSGYVLYITFLKIT